MARKSVLVAIIVLVVTLAAFAADVTGKWTYQMAGRNGSASRSVTITLKADGAKLSGSVPSRMMGRGGTFTEISNGKIDGNNIYFEVTRDIQGNSFTSKYQGTLNGDELKLKITSPGFGGGEPRTNEFTAKRDKT
jgi:uncharacterized protein (DUF2147 family)